MTAISYLESVPVTTPVTHTGDLNFTPVTGASLSGFTVGNRYLILVNALFGGDSASFTDHFGIRTLHGSTVFDGSQKRIECNNLGAVNNYSYWSVWTAAAGESITLEHATLTTAGRTVSTDEVRITAIDLDGLTEDVGAGGDWKFQADATGAAHTTSEVERLSMLWTPGNAGDNWLILSRAEIDIGSASVNADVFLRLDGTEVVRHLSMEGEDILDNLLMIQPYVAGALSAAEHDVSIGTRDDTATAGNDYVSSAVFVLRLDAFESYASTLEHTVTQVDATGVGTWDQMATLGTYAPATTGDHLLIADYRHALNFNSSGRLQFDGVSDPAGWESSLAQFDSNDTTDIGNSPLFVVASIANTGVDIDLDVQGSNTAVDFYDGSIVAISMELAAGGGGGGGSVADLGGSIDLVAPMPTLSASGSITGSGGASGSARKFKPHPRKRGKMN